jgi:GNAT superfamily N-acetyltransferase
VRRRLHEHHRDIAIRSASPGDAPSLFDVKRSASLAAYGHIFPPSEYPFPNDDVRDEVTALVADEDSAVLIAEKEGRAVGFIGLVHDEIVALFVLREVWKQGIGTMLHDAMVIPLAEKGHGRLQFWALEENRVARRFYERLGWRVDGRRRTSPYPPRPPVVGYSLDLGPSWQPAIAADSEVTRDHEAAG